MSFFAGNGKLHITNQERTLESMNTNTIYPDTVFHSNMQSICSLGEYQSQAQPVTFYVNGMAETCFEAAIPAEVCNHLLDNKVVLVTMGNISTFINDVNPKEAPIAFPINIKAGTGGGILSNSGSRSVVTSPQVTVGGLLDISYSVNAIANRNIVVSSVDEDGANQHSPDNVNGWSADPDYSAGGKVTNLMRPNSKFMQYHARGLRLRLSDYSTSNVQASRPDTPYYLGLAGLQHPIFTFIVLNIRFTLSNVYEFINPLTYSNSEGIVLEGDNLSINGTKFNSVKIIQSRNPSAKGSFVLGKYLNRMLPAVTYTNVGIDTTQTRQYKQWSMCNFMQGAKHFNGLPAFMQGPGTYERVDCWGATNNATAGILDLALKAHICDYGLSNNFSIEKDLLGYPMPGYPANNNYQTYRRRSDTLLFEQVGGATGPHGYWVEKEPFALLDTSKFSSMYITKDGISGQYFDGATTHTIPIWNNASPPTHMITGTKTLYFSPRWVSVSLNTTTITVNQGSHYMGFTKSEESLLIGVRIDNNIGTNLYRPSTTHYGNNDYYMACWDNKALTGMYTADGVVHGLVKLKDGEELVIAQMYVQGGSKWQELGGIDVGDSDSAYNKAVQILSVGIFVMYTIKREGNSLISYSRVKLDYDNYEVIINRGTLDAGDWTLNFLNIPGVDAYVVRIQ